jgi:hypothetical protein
MVIALAAEITIDVECWKCHDHYYIETTEDKLKRWQAGEHIQNVMPELSADHRELLISRTCPRCWDELWKED